MRTVAEIAVATLFVMLELTVVALIAAPRWTLRRLRKLLGRLLPRRARDRLSAAT
jgi:hypothetical protein